MIPYTPPVRDMAFTLQHVVGLDRLRALPGQDELNDELVDAVLDSAAKLASEVIAPLNQIGDRQGAALENGVVRLPEGFAEAYRAYVEGGWNAVPFDPEFGGQGLPWALAMPVAEMWQSASMAFALCPMLNQGAVEAIAAHGSDAQKQVYLPKLISGEWTGTMNLTEPQAGSDLAAVRTKAEPAGEHYRIRGQKIYITYGEHELAENIIHLVLARLPDAPEGVKGISLFIVPKYLPNEDGTPGQRNDLRCVALEHKLGIHASPTCTMAFGDNEGAIGYLVGEPHQGLKYMFTMMNNARLTVGIQGVAIGERAYQQARDYAKDRIQGRAVKGGTGDVAIIEHPDIRRTLMTMRAYNEAGRAMAYLALAAADLAAGHPDAEIRQQAQREVDLMTPIVKAWCTDRGVEVASMGVQVHGGMGYVEETGAAQHLRDARIAPIYEGTNGIQAADLVFRKTLRDEGAALRDMIARIRADLPGPQDRATGSVEAALARAVDDLETALSVLITSGAEDAPAAAHAAQPFVKLCGHVIGGWCLARQARAASGLNGATEGDLYLSTKIATAQFFADHLLPEASAAARSVVADQHAALKLPVEAF